MIYLRYRNGTTDTIRLLGVDTPEVSGDVNPEEFEGIPDTEAGRNHLREWATRASSFARERLAGREVEVVTDPQADRRDRYGRSLAYVVPDGGGENTGSGENAFNAADLSALYSTNPMISTLLALPCLAFYRHIRYTDPRYHRPCGGSQR